MMTLPYRFESRGRMIGHVKPIPRSIIRLALTAGQLFAIPEPCIILGLSMLNPALLKLALSLGAYALALGAFVFGFLSERGRE